MLNDFSNHHQTVAATAVSSHESTLFLAKVFNWMALGLGLTALVAFMVANSAAAQQMIFGNKLVFYGLIFGELGMVIYLSARIEKISAGAATSLFLVYSALNGATLSAILLIYTASSVAATFFIAGGMFAAMAVYGTVTKKDLTSMGSFMMMGLMGMIIAMLVNIFLRSSMMEWVISAIGVIVFTGLTAYDVQKISNIGAAGIMNGGEAIIRKGAIMGALALYLDFINLFLSLLRLMGDRR
ncbi:MAG: Bax inhibitor-1/YccA family protein [Proteobacteria bacterium]|nr:Bax inhibitor-1/YccA family protein [Pseudomonadota bacterium]MBU1738600.1 Bax inhibitor-1/YccA family protein [Pseudomonadota bacterium]